MLDILGTGPEYIFRELEKAPNVSCKDTEEELVYNLSNMTGNENYLVNGRKFNWEKLYGKLEKRTICICFIK